MSQHSLGIGGYGFLSGLLGQINLTQELGDIMGKLAHINVIIASLVGVITLVIKGIDLWVKVKRMKKETNEPTSEGDS